MSEKRIALALASFADSSQGKALDGLQPEAVRQIAGSFLAICYEELGKKPHLLDGHDVHQALGHSMPGRLKRKDPIAPHVPRVLRAFFEHLGEEEVVTNAFEIAQAIEATEDEFLETVRTGRNAHHAHTPQKPVVHRAEKLGRNDPCSCGSGKKFKKCHGK
ncbi:MAG: SEC-C metal-binding domain-containing protein [Planctomycetota bacterium]|jgi:hypothetical protein|nr:SEC-C metal-binding domain-containing protein [Planctomycetota bacterium]MDP6761482.1 SEC-C metal-binding domain-containing protein [Planctomycetota bacterium]MDP6989444.1 SEC-C metal-binding domain-containing protein [Planctomycetota bacterium]